MAYTFSAVQEQDFLAGTSKIYRLINGFDDYGNKCARIYGNLRTLFGDPLYETENNEDLYSYCIAAVSDTGNTVYLNVYSGPTGPAIGGTAGKEPLQAAQALASYINSARPSDYECQSYYLDGPCVLRMGVQNGTPFYEESALELSPEEFQQLYNRIYHLDQ